MAKMNNPFHFSGKPEDTLSDDSPVPAGKYIVECEKTGESENTPGRYWFSFRILAPTHVNRTLIDNYDSRPDISDKAQRYNARKMGTWLSLTNKSTIVDTDELIGMRCEVTVKVEPERIDQVTGNVYPERNSITSYRAIGEGASTIASSSMAQQSVTTAFASKWPVGIAPQAQQRPSAPAPTAKKEPTQSPLRASATPPWAPKE